MQLDPQTILGIRLVGWLRPMPPAMIGVPCAENVRTDVCRPIQVIGRKDPPPLFACLKEAIVPHVIVDVGRENVEEVRSHRPSRT